MRQRFQSNHIDYSGLMIWVRHGCNNGRWRNCSQLEMTTTTWETRKRDCRSIVLGNGLNHATPFYRLRPHTLWRNKTENHRKIASYSWISLSMGMICCNFMNQWRESSSRTRTLLRLSFVFRCKFLARRTITQTNSVSASLDVPLWTIYLENIVLNRFQLVIYARRKHINFTKCIHDHLIRFSSSFFTCGNQCEKKMRFIL